MHFHFDSVIKQLQKPADAENIVNSKCKPEEQRKGKKSLFLSTKLRMIEILYFQVSSKFCRNLNTNILPFICLAEAFFQHGKDGIYFNLAFTFFNHYTTFHFIEKKPQSLLTLLE